MRSVKPSPVPVPGPRGGKLIRKLVKAFRMEPRTINFSHILIAVSGGLDSVALAILIVKYGRRIVQGRGLALLHINHHWRADLAEADALWVRALAESLGVGFVREDLEPPGVASGASLEAVAHFGRRECFGRLSRSRKALVLTAHHRGDLTETLLWRMLSGNLQYLPEGIQRLDEEVGVFRPLLDVTKEDLKAFLEEERQTWREDASNLDLRFLRNRLRHEVLPLLQEVFPRLSTNLLALAEHLAQRPKVPEDPASELQAGLRAFGIRERVRLARAHFNALAKLDSKDSLGRAKQIHLPGGWRLTRDEQ